MQPTATAGLKNSTKAFVFFASATCVDEVVPFPFVAAVVVCGAVSFNSKPGLSVPSVPLVTAPLVDCILLWSTSFSINMM